jgi:hypothetical protein
LVATVNHLEEVAGMAVKSRRRRVWILGIGVAFALVVTSAALAAFRGERGRIAFDEGRTFPSGAAPGSQTVKRIYTDPLGDACCTEDIQRVVVTNTSRSIFFRITAPAPRSSEPAATSDRLIPITTDHGRFIVRNDDNGPGYVLARWDPKRAEFVELSHVHISVRGFGSVVSFSLTRRILGKPAAFRFRVEFWAVTSMGGANFDAAPDRGRWRYRLR